VSSELSSESELDECDSENVDTKTEFKGWVSARLESLDTFLFVDPSFLFGGRGGGNLFMVMKETTHERRTTLHFLCGISFGVCFGDGSRRERALMTARIAIRER
jgi:hypothetical protein